MGEVRSASPSRDVSVQTNMSNHLWCSRRLTIRVVGPDGERTVDVGKPYARIGSHPRSEVILDGPDVPSHGLYLHATDRGIFCCQLWDSSDQPTTYRGWVTPDQGIPFFDCQIFASFTDGPEPVVDPEWMLDEKGSAQLPVPVIYLLVNEERRATYRVYRRLTIVGRERPSALRLKSEYISLTHCVLYWQDGKLWFVDLLSSNGTEKRGRKCEAERFRLGRTIKLSDVLLGFARTTDEPWDADVRREDSHVEPKHIFELDAPKPQDEKLWPVGDGSSVHNIDGLPENWEEQGSSDARLDTDAAEAIKEMRRQLEAERNAWESERIEKEHLLAEQHRELDRSFAEIQSWRDELNTRTQQLELDFARLAADQHGIEQQRQQLDELQSSLHSTEQEARSKLGRHAADKKRFSRQLDEQRAKFEQQQREWQELVVEQTAQLAAEQAVLDEKRETLARERAELEAQIQHWQVWQKTTQDEQAAITDTHRRTAEQYERQRSELAALSADLDAKQRLVESQQASLKADRQQLADARRTLASDRDELESQRKALSSDRAQLDDRQRTLDADRTECASRHESLAAERDALEAQRTAHAAESAQLESARHALTAERQELEGRLQSFAAECSDAEIVRQELDALRRELTTQQQTLAAEQQELEFVRKTLDSERDELETLRASAVGARSEQNEELTQQHQALTALRHEVTEQREALEAQRKRWEAEQEQQLLAEHMRLAAAQQEAEATAAEQMGRIADAERLLALREKQADEVETRLQTETSRLEATRRELEQAQADLKTQQLELQRQTERLRQSQSETQLQMAARQKDLDTLRAELVAQQAVLADERKELAALCQTLTQDRERAQIEWQEQRSALLATRQEIESLQAQLARERESAAQTQTDLQSQRQQLDDQRQRWQAERESLGAERQELAAVHQQIADARRDLDTVRQRTEESRRALDAEKQQLQEMRRNLDAERQRLEQFAIEQTEMLAIIERERDRYAVDQRPHLAEIDDDPVDASGVGEPSSAFACAYDDAIAYVVSNDQDREAESIQCEHEFEQATTEAIDDARPAAVADQIKQPELEEPVVAASAAQPDPTAESINVSSDMGQQFEHVDPVLLGEYRSAAAEASRQTNGEPPRPVERIPVDPAADAAYDDLVDRLVQFQRSQKRKWYKLW